MASITVRNIEDALKQRLRVRAALAGRSMEDEVREILRASLADGAAPPRDLAATIRQRLEGIGGVELELPTRGPMRDVPALEE